MKRPRRRKMYKFWLDLTGGEDADLVDIIEKLKARRHFAPTLRMGFRLVLTLREAEQQLRDGLPPSFNALSLLEVLFPKVVEYIATRAHHAELTQLRAELAELRQQVALSGSMSTPKLREPARDEQDTLVIQRDTSVNTATTFMAAMLGMQNK